jgi:hypothetical protein
MKRTGVLIGAVVALLAGAAAPAVAHDGDCGSVGRPYTDGAADVAVAKGDLKCATAKSLMRRYWGTRVTAFRSTVRLRHAGIRWTCRPTGSGFPDSWECRGGGKARNRYRVTAHE